MFGALGIVTELPKQGVRIKQQGPGAANYGNNRQQATGNKETGAKKGQNQPPKEYQIPPSAMPTRLMHLLW